MTIENQWVTAAVFLDCLSLGGMGGKKEARHAIRGGLLGLFCFGEQVVENVGCFGILLYEGVDVAHALLF